MLLQQILVPLDGSKRAEKAIPIAARIAHGSHASLCLLYIVDQHTLALEYSLAMYGAEIQEALHREEMQANTYLNHIRNTECLREVDVQCTVRIDAIVPGIFHTMHTNNTDLIVLCSHGRTGFKRFLMGSVAQELVRHCPAPVLIVREENLFFDHPSPDPKRPFHCREILIPLDGTKQAENALIPAAMLITALNAPIKGRLHILCLIPNQEGAPMDKDKAHPLPPVYQVQEYAQQKAKEVQTYMQKAMMPISVTWSVCDTTMTTASAIIDIAEHGHNTLSGGSELIALSKHDRNLFELVFYPSVTERVIGHTTLPLLVV